MDVASVTINSFVETYQPPDESLALSLADLNDESYSANFVVGPLTNDPLVTFQIFFDPSWNPLVCPISTHSGFSTVAKTSKT